MNKLIGRKEEKAHLNRLLEAREADFLVVYGRRRVGKTFLIREHLKKEIAFEMTGTVDTPLAEQLHNFRLSMNRASKSRKTIAPTSWVDAFEELKSYLLTLPKKKKHVLFFDELPWLASRRSRFLPALDHFWNTFLSRHPNFLLIVCGSAASWMISKILNHKGGLHNRVTSRMRLDPFSLAETEAFLRSRKVRLTRYEILTLTMACGGIPHYLKEVLPGESAGQAIHRTCFTSHGFLRDEFPRLYHSLFENADRHLDLIRILAKRPRGMTRSELSKTYTSGGRLTRTLEELTEAGFVSATLPFQKKKKDTLFRISDEYSIFYLRWIEPQRTQRQNIFTKIQTSPSWRAWSGYALENLAQRHLPQLKRALGIYEVEAYDSSWVHLPNKTWPDGSQIDLLLDRADNTINLIEIKFSQSPFTINKTYANTLRKRLETFRGVTKTNKNTFLTFITTHGLTDNSFSRELAHQTLKTDDLFEF